MDSSNFHRAVSAIEGGDKVLAASLMQKANDAYYSSEETLMSDDEFDTLLLMFQEQFGEEFVTAPKMLDTKGNRIGTPHPMPEQATWLSKVHGIEQLFEWIDERCSSLACTYALSPKYDGLSIVHYHRKNGEFYLALTRGEDGMGMDVTKFFEGSVQPFPPQRADFSVKYEAVMSWADLYKLNEETNSKYKNPRNTVSGIINSQNPDLCKYVSLAPLDVRFKNKHMRREDRLTWIQAQFGADYLLFNYVLVDHDGCGNPTREEVRQYYGYVENLRNSTDFGFMLDGIVVELVDDVSIEHAGGERSMCSRHAVAMKFPPEKVFTTARAMEWDIGPTGRMTPCVVFDPVFMNGNTYSRTSIANMTRFDKLQLAPGTPLQFELRGDIIGWLDRAGPDIKGSKPFPEPIDCEYTYNEDGERVFAYTAMPLEGRCDRMMVKCGVKGVRIETLTKLVEAGVITKLGDVWTLPQRIDDVSGVPGLGSTSANNIVSAIQNKLKKGLYDWEVMASIGIIGVGRSISKEALKVHSLSELIELAKIDGSSSALEKVLGPTRAPMLIAGIKENLETLLDLIHNCGITILESRGAAVNSDGPFYKFVVTGDISGWDREDFRDAAEQNGHKMVGSVSKKVDFVISNDPNSGTVKTKKAMELGIRILSEQDALPLLGVSARKKSEIERNPEMTVVDIDDL